MADGRSGSDIAQGVAAASSRPAEALAGHRAVPARGAGRGVLVLGEEGRVSALSRDAADRLARAGFVALATEAGADATPAALAGGISALLDDHAVEGARVGVLGFDRGGVLGLALAATQRRVGAVIDFYGLPDEEELAALAGLQAPALLLFGDADERVETGALRALASRVPNAHLHLEPGAGRGYMDARLADRHAAAAEASGWDRALAFLAAAL